MYTDAQIHTCPQPFPSTSHLSSHGSWLWMRKTRMRSKHHCGNCVWPWPGTWSNQPIDVQAWEFFAWACREHMFSPRTSLLNPRNLLRGDLRWNRSRMQGSVFCRRTRRDYAFRLWSDRGTHTCLPETWCPSFPPRSRCSTTSRCPWFLVRVSCARVDWVTGGGRARSVNRHWYAFTQLTIRKTCVSIEKKNDQCEIKAFPSTAKHFLSKLVHQYLL